MRASVVLLSFRPEDLDNDGESSAGTNDMENTNGELPIQYAVRTRLEMTQPSLRDLPRRYPTVPALKCRATLVASLTGRSSEDLMMVHQTNQVRLRILRHTFCPGLESTLDTPSIFTSSTYPLP